MWHTQARVTFAHTMEYDIVFTDGAYRKYHTFECSRGGFSTATEREKQTKKKPSQTQMHARIVRRVIGGKCVRMA